MVGRGVGAAVITVMVPPGTLAEGAVLTLDPSEIHHLRVRRARPDDLVRLVDGHGSVANGWLGMDRREGKVRVERVERTPRPPALGLAVGAGDRDRFGWLVEKSAELGVTDVVPVETERTASVGGRVKGEHVEKLQRRALEAIKQSGAAWAPVVHLPHQLAELVVRHRTGVRWLADAAGCAPCAVDASTGAWAMVGPEGGLTEAERQLLIDEGWVPVCLGPHVLRFETAALAAAVWLGGNR